MSYFIKEVNRKTEEFEIFLNDEEYYAWETKDPKYLEFLKKIGELSKEEK